MVGCVVWVGTGGVCRGGCFYPRSVVGDASPGRGESAVNGRMVVSDVRTCLFEVIVEACLFAQVASVVAQAPVVAGEPLQVHQRERQGVADGQHGHYAG